MNPRKFNERVDEFFSSRGLRQALAGMQKAVETKLFRSKRGGEPIKTVGRLLGSFGDEFVERKAVTHGESREVQCTAYTYVE